MWKAELDYEYTLFIFHGRGNKQAHRIGQAYACLWEIATATYKQHTLGGKQRLIETS